MGTHPLSIMPVAPRPCRELAAEQLAQLREMAGDAVLLPGQVVHLALCHGAVPLGLGLGVGQQLARLRLGLRDDLVGTLLGAV